MFVTPRARSIAPILAALGLAIASHGRPALATELAVTQGMTQAQVNALIAQLAPRARQTSPPLPRAPLPRHAPSARQADCVASGEGLRRM